MNRLTIEDFSENLSILSQPKLKLFLQYAVLKSLLGEQRFAGVSPVVATAGGKPTPDIYRGRPSCSTGSSWREVCRVETSIRRTSQFFAALSKFNFSFLYVLCASAVKSIIYEPPRRKEHKEKTTCGIHLGKKFV
jgi:hypothetical protein